MELLRHSTWYRLQQQREDEHVSWPSTSRGIPELKNLRKEGIETQLLRWINEEVIRQVFLL